jgi:hypothetical protein
MSIRSRLPELESLEALLPEMDARVRVLGEVVHGRERLPIHAVLLGPDDPTLPTLLYTGGVHGLERVGTQILVSYLRTIKVALSWDEVLRETLRRIRLLFVPLLNPVGMAQSLRSNGHGVDLMRNAPVEAEEGSRWFELHRGQRLTPLLPWYRGQSQAGMEVESRALCDFVEQEVFPSSFAIGLDVHSGFLAGDRIWFPYAGTRALFPNTPELWALKHLLHETHEHHVYTVEPQSLNYTTHGDLWDYLYDQYRAANPSGVFLPLTLEISSYLWYRKNPRQLFSRSGLFHPIKHHRLARVQRRHKTLFDFLSRAVFSCDNWLPRDEAHRAALHREAEQDWVVSEVVG